ARRRGVARPLREPHPHGAHGLGLHHLHQDRQQVEHVAHRPHDLLPRGHRPHPGAARPPRQVREQDPDTRQDRPQLEDALALPARRLLHPEGARRPRHALHGPRAHPPVRPPLLEAGTSPSSPSWLRVVVVESAHFLCLFLFFFFFFFAPNQTNVGTTHFRS